MKYLLSAIALICLVLFVANLPFDSDGGGGTITEYLYGIADRQEHVAEVVTDEAVSGVEGTLVGEDAVNGSNWSIPNILRHLLSGGLLDEKKDD